MLEKAYATLPENLKPIAKRAYFWTHPSRVNPDREDRGFIEGCFDDRTEFQQYRDEFESGRGEKCLTEAANEFNQIGGNGSFGGLEFEIGVALYALVRKWQPESIVETGVCNGTSTLFYLLALQENDHGELHSIDYPFYANESLEEFRAQTFAGYGGAAIPSDKEPGWIIPDGIRDRWNLTIGKSQYELPKLLDELEEVDLFMHDSEHSAPCMMMEFELAYSHLSDGGWILSDDISWNDAWELFWKHREIQQHGKITPQFGYLRK